MDGLGFKAPSGIIDDYFYVDAYGLYVPRQESLQMEAAKQRFERLVNSETDTLFKLNERYYLTDVGTTQNPYGNSNVIGFGVRRFGPQPLSAIKFSGKMALAANDSAAVGLKSKLERREKRIETYALDVLAAHKECAPNDDDPKLKVLHEIEHDQALTGGGFDGNSIGDVTNTALKGMLKCTALPQIADTSVSEMFVKSCIEFRDYLESHGLKRGSLQPDGLSKVRFEQDNDGMFGFPVMKKGGAPLTSDIATRLLIESGVDTRMFVDTEVRDDMTGTVTPYRIQDALAYVLDHGTFSARDLTSLVIFLARIQKHGWKMEDGKLIAKPGKARAVFPNSAREACIEGMLINPYNRALQELKMPCFTSLQDKPTRVNIIKDWMKANSANGYGFLAADWSQYDATVPGWGLATILQVCVKPFFKSQYYNWVDAVTLILTYKYFIVDEDLARINADNYNECLSKVSNVQVNRYRLFGLKDYLISGAKFTHVGGSEYGVCSIHLTIPKLLGFKGIVGEQAGDDTLMGVPLSSIHLDSKEATYQPIADAAKKLGLDINPSKQIFYSANGELVGIFLQDSYCEKADIWGVGTAFRPLAAVCFSERNKGLSIAEQLIAEVSRMNQGADNPFCDAAVKFWLSQEQFLGVLVKERGAEEAFQLLIESVGLPIEEVTKRIEVGSFTYGIGIDELRSGKLPILPVMDRAVSNMSFTVNIDKALSELGVAPSNAQSDSDSFPSDNNEEEFLGDDDA